MIKEINKQFNDSIEVATQYYQFINILNNYNLQLREIQLLAVASVKGNINSARKYFLELNPESSIHVINNCFKQLKKLGLITRDIISYKVSPEIAINFSTDTEFNINICYKQKELQTN